MGRHPLAPPRCPRAWGPTTMVVAVAALLTACACAAWCRRMLTPAAVCAAPMCAGGRGCCHAGRGGQGDSFSGEFSRPLLSTRLSAAQGAIVSANSKGWKSSTQLTALFCCHVLNVYVLVCVWQVDEPGTQTMDEKTTATRIDCIKW